MHRVKSTIIDLIALFIITAPAYFRILNNQYFSMHDDQHIARLFLLDQGIRQGYLYPRWVDGLGFGFGYPLYNFYPPLIYYLGELFHLLGFSFIWSIKLVFILGFYLGALGIYLLVKKIANRLAALLSATLYTYFFYHAVLIYVRGALAEFFSLAILPFVFLTLYNLKEKIKLRQSIFFGIVFVILIITHPLIALPSLIFIGFYILFYLFQVKEKQDFIKYVLFGGLIGISLSAFFWLPSIAERKYTMTDQILTGELASYKLHYIYPQQFIYSPWGYGGSAAGLADGVTFQLGKIHIGLAIFSLLLFFIYILKTRKIDKSISHYLLLTFLLFLSLFMTTKHSSFIWDNFKYLWYLQFPWRFLTFTSVFISIAGAYSFHFLMKLIEQLNPNKNTINRLIVFFAGFLLIVFTTFIYQKYFKPQKYIQTTDKKRTSVEEISWRISRTSYEFVPKGVKTKKSELNTTILDIEKENLPKKPYEIIRGQASVSIIKNKMTDKEFVIRAKMPLVFRLNTYNFPGWNAYLNSQKTLIDDKNDLKLITLNIPSGSSNLRFVFENTRIRNISNIISLLSLATVIFLLFKKFKKVDK